MSAISQQNGHTTHPRMIYIGGWGRSGSTLLARLLGEHPEMLFVGELRDLWHRGVAENRVCGCGVPFDECEFWGPVGELALGGWDSIPLAEMTRLRDVVDKPWWVPFLRADRLPRRIESDVARYVDILSRVINAMMEVGGTKYLVDSSKIPSFALLADRIPEVDLRVVHLVRDARGSVHSWQKSVVRTDTADGSDGYMLQYSPTSAAARYLLYNTQADALSRGGRPYVRVRYEDLVADPRLTLNTISDELGLGGWDAGQVRGNEIMLGPSHSVVGNPMRMNTGWTPLKADTAWRESLDDRTRLLVSIITAPALRRYGYPLGTS